MLCLKDSFVVFYHSRKHNDAPDDDSADSDHRADGHEEIILKQVSQEGTERKEIQTDAYDDRAETDLLPERNAVFFRYTLAVIPVE